MLHTNIHTEKPDWLERGPIVVGYDAVRIVRLDGGSLRMEVWQPDRHCWQKASLPSDVVLRAAPADEDFLESIHLTEAECTQPPH